jgi:hypothetical protein
MEKRYNPYIKQAIEASEESKKTIVVSREIIESTTDDRLLGMMVRGMLITKIRNCDEHIEYMKSLKENFLPTDSPDELQ